MKPNLAEDIIAISEFRKNTSSYIRDIRLKKRTLVLTQDGHSAAIVLSPEEYEKIQYEREFLKAIAQGEREIEEGLGIPHEKVFSNLFAKLQSH